MEMEQQEETIPMMAVELLALQRHARQRSQVLATIPDGGSPFAVTKLDACERRAMVDNDPAANGMDQKATP